MTELQKLQKEYKEISERMGYMKNPINIAAANNMLDRICKRMNKLLNKQEDIKMRRYMVIYEGYIFEGDTDGVNIRYAEKYSDIAWMRNAYEDIKIIDTFYEVQI